MISLKLPAIEEPNDPDMTDQLTFKMWKMKRRAYKKKKETRTRNENCMFALLLRQCSQALQNQMEPHEKWRDANADANVIMLLKLIQSCMSHKQARKDADHTAVDADIAIYRFNQNNLPDNVYYEKNSRSLSRQLMQNVSGVPA